MAAGIIHLPPNPPPPRIRIHNPDILRSASLLDARMWYGISGSRWSFGCLYCHRNFVEAVPIPRVQFPIFFQPESGCSQVGVTQSSAPEIHHLFLVVADYIAG